MTIPRGLITDDIVVSRNTAALTYYLKGNACGNALQCFNALVVQCACLHLTLKVQEQNVFWLLLHENICHNFVAVCYEKIMEEDRV